MTIEPGTHNRRTAIVIGALVTTALAVAVVLAIVARPATYPADSPERAVQQYLQAMLDDDVEAAFAWLDPDRDCDPDLIDRGYVPDDVRITFDDVVVDGDIARVDVRITLDSDADLFDLTRGYDFVERFRLRLTADGWRITTAPWPYIPCQEVTP